MIPAYTKHVCATPSPVKKRVLGQFSKCRFTLNDKFVMSD